MFTNDLMVHFLKSEEKIRKSMKTQEIYRAVRASQKSGLMPPEVPSVDVMNSLSARSRTASYVTEDDIQRYMLQLHGVPGLKIRVNLDTDGKAFVNDGNQGYSESDLAISNSILDQYRSIALSFVHVPEVRQAAFFLRNNIQTRGYTIGTIVNKSLPLVLHSLQGTELEREKQSTTTVGNLLISARQSGKDFLVFLCGSIT